MYSRPVTDPPPRLIKYAKPVFGTFSGVPVSLDIRGVYMPFGIIPMPVVITNLRIKSRIDFIFSTGDYIGTVSIHDAKIFGFAEIIFWNTQTHKKYIYRSLSGPRHRFIPHEMTSAACTYHQKKFYIRISWDHTHDRISMILNIKAEYARPGVNIAFVGLYSDPCTAEMSNVIPAPTMRRCSGSCFTSFPLHGSISLSSKKGTVQIISNTDGLGFLHINRMYYKFRSKSKFLTAMGFVDGKKVEFRIEQTTQDSVDPDKYNSNLLFVDGTATPLPPIHITHPFGLMGPWNIQDTESMVDLTFTPISENERVLSIVVLRTEYQTIYGTCEGTLLTCTGDHINIHQIPGIAKNVMLRL